MTSGSPATPIEIRLFGSFALKVGGVPVSGVPKAVQSLLLLLISHQDQCPSREVLASAIWPDTAPETADYYLRRALSQLRTFLGNERERLQADLTLDLTNCRCDYLEFLKGGAEAGREYAGQLVIGKRTFYMEALAEHAHQQFIASLFEFAKKQKEAGNTEVARDSLQRMLSIEQTREDGCRELMSILSECGDFVGVSRLYRSLRTRLAAEYGIEPAQETTQLYHRLMGLSKLTQLEQTTAEAAQTPRVDKIVPPLTHLIGRTRDVELIQEALSLSRVVVIVGLGGVGKTRIAMEIVGQTPKAFGVDVSTLTSLEDSLESLRSLGPEALVLLDNAEDKLELCGDLVAHLIHEFPSLHLLVTSRIRPEWLGIRTYHLKPLNVPREDANIPALLSSEAVELFVERATDVDPDFALSPLNAVAVMSICRRLDGMPLAIELAAARLRSFSAAQIEQRLTDQFTFLKKWNSTRALVEILDWTYEALSEEQQSLFRDIAWFPASWTQEACASISPHFSLENLEKLIELDLVSRSGERYRCLETVRSYGQRLSKPDKAWARRFVSYYYETIPAVDDISTWFSDESPNLRRAFELPLQIRDRQLLGDVLRLYNRCYDFWRRVGRMSELFAYGRQLTSIDIAPDEESVSALFATANAAHLLSRLDEAEQLFERAEEMAESLGILAWKADSLRHRAELKANQGKIQVASEMFEMALELFRTTGNRAAEAQCIGSLGYLARERGDFEASLRLTQEALEINTQMGLHAECLWCIGSLGALYLEVGEVDRAAKYFKEAIDSCKPDSDRYSRIWNLNMLAEVELRRGDFMAALRYIEESIAIRGDDADDLALEWPLSLRGAIMTELGDYSGAERSLNEAWRLHQLAGASKLGTMTLVRLADLHWRQEHLAQAHSFCKMAEDRNRSSEVEQLTQLVNALKHKMGIN